MGAIGHTTVGVWRRHLPSQMFTLSGGRMAQPLRSFVRAVGLIVACVLASIGLFSAGPASSLGLAQPGIDWTLGSGLADNDWNGVAFGNGRFVAIANAGPNRVMTSVDGQSWSATGVTGVTSHTWTGVSYGNGVFVAISFDQAVMTSVDGLSWTAATPTGMPSGVGWEALTFGGGKFVAVGQQGSATERVMTSANGITWTAGTITGPNATWHGVTYGGGKYVAVGFEAPNNNSVIITSSDGLTWSAATPPGSIARFAWSVTYGAGHFVAVTASSDGVNQVMTSPDGSTWSLAQSATSSGWRSIGFGNGLFVAGGVHAIMTSPDGTAWTSRTNPVASSDWRSIAYQNGIFVAVGDSGDGGTGNRAMYSGVFTPAALAVTGVSPATGSTAGGTSVTVTGAGFIPGLTVTIGGASCSSVSVASSTSLSCVTPPGTLGPAKVEVTNVGEPGATLSAGFTYGSSAVTQQPANECVIAPKNLKRSGTAKIMKPQCQTTVGVPIKASGAAKTPRGDIRYYRIFKTKSGTYVRTYGYQLNLTLTWKSKATPSAAAYRSSKLYRIR